jgi:hypothetical protein
MKAAGGWESRMERCNNVSNNPYYQRVPFSRTHICILQNAFAAISYPPAS